jgi:hypothetical protein
VGRKVSEEVRRQRQELQKRVIWVLNNLFRGKQRRMAAAMGMSQSLISRVANGQQGAGREFLEALKRLPGLNPRWVDAGEGEPLLPPTKGTLPIARGILPGEPAAYPELLTGERHPVAEAFERPSRYWVRLLPEAPVLQIREQALLAGDLILFEADRRIWEGRLNEYAGQLCGVRLAKDGNVSFELALLKHGLPRLISELIDPSKDPMLEGKKAAVEEIAFGRRVRSIEIGPPDTTVAASPQPDTPVVEKDILAVQLYMARPWSGR